MNWHMFFIMCFVISAPSCSLLCWFVFFFLYLCEHPSFFASLNMDDISWTLNGTFFEREKAISLLHLRMRPLSLEVSWNFCQFVVSKDFERVLTKKEESTSPILNWILVIREGENKWNLKGKDISFQNLNKGKNVSF